MRLCEMISVYAGDGPGPDDGFVSVEVPCTREARWLVAVGDVLELARGNVTDAVGELAFSALLDGGMLRRREDPE